MPKGFQGAKKVGEFKGGSGFQPRPKGISFFSLQDQQTAIVRFTTQHEDVDWMRKWKLPPSGNFIYGEFVNAVDQFEDGTADPGYAAGLKSSFKGYVVMIWRSAPVYQKDGQGNVVKDATTKRKTITGYADQVVLWECSYEVYSTLQELDAKYRGLMSRDFEVKRKGASTDTKYVIMPGDPEPLSPADQQLIATNRIDLSMFLKVPTYDELNNYISGGSAPAPQPSFGQQATENAAGGDGPNPFLS